MNARAITLDWPAAVVAALMIVVTGCAPNYEREGCGLVTTTDAYDDGFVGHNIRAVPGGWEVEDPIPEDDWPGASAIFVSDRVVTGIVFSDSICARAKS